MYTIMIPSHRPKMVAAVVKVLGDQPHIAVDGTNAPSFSWLVNQCVVDCPTERVIICGDKCHPSMENIDKLNSLLNSGYGLVGLYRFGFFGFDKELFRRIGPMDERFIGGNYEDDDYMLRMKEADIALYISEEVLYLPLRSSWPTRKARSIFRSKWGSRQNIIRRLSRENPHYYEFGESVPRSFLSWKHSVLTESKKAWLRMPLIKNVTSHS